MRLSIALHALVLALVALVYSPFTFAAPANVAAVADGVLDQLLAIVLVGSAVLLLVGGIAALRYLRDVMGGGTAFDTSRDLAPHVRGYVDGQSYLDALASRLAAEDERNGVNLNAAADLRGSQRADALASGADMAQYDKYMSEEDTTHEEALRWSSMSGQISMPVVPAAGVGNWDSAGNYVAPLKSWEK